MNLILYISVPLLLDVIKLGIERTLHWNNGKLNEQLTQQTILEFNTSDSHKIWERKKERNVKEGSIEIICPAECISSENCSQ